MAFFFFFLEQEGIEASILRGLALQGRGLGASSAPQHPALLVVSPKAAVRQPPFAGSCRTALLPGDTPLPGWQLQAASAVSYGTAPKNSLTVSSRREGRLWAALQRELVTVEGLVVEQQEFPVPLPRGMGELAALAAAGALVLLGVPPASLGAGREGEQECWQRSPEGFLYIPSVPADTKKVNAT